MASKATLIVRSEFPKLSTRPEGIDARNVLLKRLQQYDHIVLDFADAVLTPSFAEEFIGKLAAHLGSEEFARRISMSNTSDHLDSLLRLVIVRQTRRTAPPAA